MDQDRNSQHLFQIHHQPCGEGKKLRDAAHLIAGGGDNKAEVVNDLKELGAPQEVIDAYQVGNDDFEIWPIHVPIAEFFLSIQSQWRRHPMSGAPLGLDYAGVEAAAKWQGITLDRAFFADLRVMEFAYIEEAIRRVK